MSISEPTLGEVVRRLDEAVRELREMRAEMARDRERFEQRFLPRSEFEAARRTTDVMVEGLENEVHSAQARLNAQEERRRADRMLVFSALIAPVLVALITYLLLAQP